MTTVNDARAAIYALINSLGIATDWGAANITLSESDDVWIRPSVRFGSGSIQTLGGTGVATRRRRGGTIIVQVFSPLGEGEGPGDDVADQLLRLFEAQRSGPVYYRDVALRDIGRDESWWQQNVTVNFEYDVVCI